MFTQLTENISKFNEQSADSVRQASEIGQKTSQKLLEMQSTWFSQAIKFSVDQAQLISKAQDPSAYFADQATLVNEYVEQNAKNAEELIAVATASGTETREFVEQGVEQAQVTLRAVATEATPKTKAKTKKKAA